MRKLQKEASDKVRKMEIKKETINKQEQTAKSKSMQMAKLDEDIDIPV